MSFHASRLIEFVALVGIDQISIEQATQSISSLPFSSTNPTLDKSYAQHFNDDATYKETKPIIYDIYPTNFKEESFCAELPLFCFPYGAQESMHSINQVVKQRQIRKETSFYTFILTDEQKNELFVSCLQIFIPIQTTRKIKISKSTTANNSTAVIPVEEVVEETTSTDAVQLFGSTMSAGSSSANFQSNFKQRSLLIAGMEFSLQGKSNKILSKSRQRTKLRSASVDADISTFVYEELPVVVYQPVCMVMASRLPLYTFCKSILHVFYEKFIREYAIPVITIKSNLSTIPSVDLNEFFQGLQHYLSNALFFDNKTNSPIVNTETKRDTPLFELMPHLMSNIEKLVYYCPIPPPGKIQLSFKFLNSHFSLGLPDIDDFPLCDVALQMLFKCLDETNVVHIINHALFDSKIVFISESLSLLNLCAEALKTLLYPFLWRHVVISILPLQLIDMLQAPVPFMVGLHASLKEHVLEQQTTGIDKVDSNQEDAIVMVDLDSNRVSRTPKVPFPKQETDFLIKYLRLLMRPEITNADWFEKDKRTKKQIVDNRMIREVFVKFFASIVGSVDEFLITTKTTVENVVDRAIRVNASKYLNARPETHRDFLSSFLETQAFEEFIYNSENFLYQEIVSMDESEIEDFFKFKRESRSTFLATYLVKDTPTTIRVSGSDTNLEGLETSASEEATEQVLKSISELMKTYQDQKEIQARLYVMRALVYERSHQHLKCIQDLACAKDVEPRLVKQEWIKSNLLKLKDDEMEFAISMGNWIPQLIRTIELPKKVQQYLYQDNQTNNWFASLKYEKPKQAIDFSVIKSALAEINSKQSTVSKGKFYIIMNGAGLISRSWTATLIYDSLCEREGAELSIHMALTFFKKLELLGSQNVRIAPKILTDTKPDDYIVASSSLCTNMDGTLGRLYISVEDLYFGLSNFVKVISFSEIATVEKVDHENTGEDVRRPKLRTKESIVIRNSNGKVWEFAMASDRDVWYSYINELSKAYKEIMFQSVSNFMDNPTTSTTATKQDNSISKNSKIRETANLILISITLNFLNRTTKESLFSDQNLSTSKTITQILTSNNSSDALK